MKVHTIFFKNKLRNFCYLLDLGDGKLICLDPFNHSEVQSYIISNNLNSIFKLLVTHDHCDHHDGCLEIAKAFNCPVYAHKDAHFATKTNNLSDQEVIHEFEEWQLKALYTPGHTMSHVAFLLFKNKVPYAIFTGDCFFNAGIGNCYNGGDVSIMHETIQNIFLNLPDKVLIYPGHEYLKRNLEFTNFYEATNLDAIHFLNQINSINLDDIFVTTNMKIEKKINMFLRLNSVSIREKLNIDSIIDPKEVFFKLRELRNKW